MLLFQAGDGGITYRREGSFRYSTVRGKRCPDLSGYLSRETKVFHEFILQGAKYIPLVCIQRLKYIYLQLY
jgi:hypothetical protein